MESHASVLDAVKLPIVPPFSTLWSRDDKTTLSDILTCTKMSSSRDYRWATDPLTNSVRSLPYRELQKKCSSVNLQATGPQDVLMNRYLNYLRSSNSTIVAGDNSEEPTRSDGARAAASTPSTKTIVDISSFDSEDSTSTTDNDESIQGQKRERQDSEAAATRPRLKCQKTDNQPYKEYICPITLVSTALVSSFFFRNFLIFFRPCHNRTSPLIQWQLKMDESTTNTPSESILRGIQTATKCSLRAQNNS